MQSVLTWKPSSNTKLVDSRTRDRTLEVGGMRHVVLTNSQLHGPEYGMLRDFEDEIVRESLVTHQGKVFNARIAETIEKSASSLAGGQVVNS